MALSSSQGWNQHLLTPLQPSLASHGLSSLGKAIWWCAGWISIMSGFRQFAKMITYILLCRWTKPGFSRHGNGWFEDANYRLRSNKIMKVCDVWGKSSRTRGFRFHNLQPKPELPLLNFKAKPSESKHGYGMWRPISRSLTNRASWSQCQVHPRPLLSKECLLPSSHGSPRRFCCCG